MKPESKIMRENKAQAAALEKMAGDIISLIENGIGAEMREILTAYESEHGGNVPSGDEIIWEIGVHHNCDPRMTCVIGIKRVDNDLTNLDGEKQ